MKLYRVNPTHTYRECIFDFPVLILHSLELRVVLAQLLLQLEVGVFEFVAFSNGGGQFLAHLKQEQKIITYVSLPEHLAERIQKRYPNLQTNSG